MASFELKMPKLGESVTEGTIGKWLKQPGEKVAKYDLLVEVQTDKVNTEIPSEVDGVLREIRVKEGETVAVGTPLAVFETAGADVAAPATEVSARAGTPGPPAAGVLAGSPPSSTSRVVPPAQAPALAAPASPPSPPPVPVPAAASAAPPPRAGEDVRATPAVRKLAAEHNVDLARIEGSGLGGRVSKHDVEKFIAQGGQPAARSGNGQPAAPAGAAAHPPPLVDEVVALTPMRKAIANAMVLSKSTIPHAAAMMEIDWTNVAKFRRAVGEQFKAREGFELTYLPFAMKAVCLALRNNPLVNASWTDAGIAKHKAINLGVAIALGDEGLVVPVVKNAEDLSITGLAKAVRDLATRARAKKLTLADFEGGTFTVNNGGTLGTYLSYPIVNPGQGAIMTTEAIGKRVVALDDDSIGIRTMGNVVISFDHRVMDGATAARFLRDVKAWIQAVDASNVSLS
ncbi:MAG: 2-oxo acid dehydrogenase subunit E2 [Chloroflexi bacterium]|nr:2-oxo acid dehydrogenase subunit E2 [Chloroflexota bacterium]